MKKLIKIVTGFTFWLSVFMLLLYIFLACTTEFQWTFVYSLPATAEWILDNILIRVFEIGTYVAPALGGLGVLLTVIYAVKHKETVSKDLDISRIVITLVFAMTAMACGLIDHSTVAFFLQ